MNCTPLVNAVLSQLSDDEHDAIETLRKVAHHCSADAGWPGFTYYRDTCEFFSQHRELIIDHVKQSADDFDQDVISFVAGFNCLTDDRETRDEIGRAIYGAPNADDVSVQNALSWYALEESAREAFPDV